MNSPEFIKTGRRNLKPSQQQEVQQKVQNLMGDSLYKSKKNFYRKIQEKQNKFEGYQISVQIPKEKSYDEKYKEKYIDFINKFFSNGHFEMSVFLPHIFGDQQIQNFKEEYQDLNFQMKKIVFEEADYQFYQRIYQFKGQIEPEIQPKVQMLIYDFIFKKIISQTQGTSYSFIYDYHTCQCSVYLPNTNLHSPKEATQFFISNVLQEFNQYAILQIETNSQEECLAQSKLIKSLIEKLEKKMDTKIELVYISLQKLKLEGNWNDWFKQQLKSDKIYLVYQKTNLDQQTMNIDMTKFISDQINRKSMQFQIEIDDPPEDEDQQLQALKIHYKNISIEKDKPFKKTQDGLIVEFTLSGWYTSLVEQEKINSSHVEIKQKLNSIYKPFYQIKLTNQDQIHIWVHYLKDQLTPDEQKQIKDEQQQKPNNYIIKISTTFQDYEQLSKKIQQQLQQVLINIVKIKIVNKKLSSALIDQDINQNTFQQILNNFQQNVQDKLLKVIITVALDSTQM